MTKAGEPWQNLSFRLKPRVSERKGFYPVGAFSSGRRREMLSDEKIYGGGLSLDIRGLGE